MPNVSFSHVVLVSLIFQNDLFLYRHKLIVIMQAQGGDAG